MATADSSATSFPNRDYGKFQTELVGKIKEKEIAHGQRGASSRRQLNATIASIEKERLEKMKQFKSDCNKEMSDYDSRAQDDETKLKAKQVEQHAAFMAKLKLDTEPKAPHGSQEYFRLRKIEEMLFQQKKYPEANQHKERAEALAKIEHAAWEENRNKKIKSYEVPFVQKQQQTAASHRQRSEKARLELLNKHNTEDEKIQRLFDAKKSHAEEQHHFEMRKHDIYPDSTLKFANSLVLPKRTGAIAAA